MTNVLHPLWIERPDGGLTAAGHTEPRPVAGHVIYNPATEHYHHLVRGRHDRLEYWRIAPENIHHFGLLGGPATN